MIVSGIVYRNPQTDAALIGPETGFGVIWPAPDYRLEIPALQSVIKIKEVTQGPNIHSFQMEDHCSLGAGQARCAPLMQRPKATIRSTRQPN